MSTLTIGGVQLPPIKYGGAQKSSNKIWSKNTGRNENGDMVGSIIAIKKKWEFEFTPLTQAQVDLLETIISDVSNPFKEVIYTNNAGHTDTFNMYSGDITYPLTWDAPGRTRYDGVKVSIIEQ